MPDGSHWRGTPLETARTPADRPVVQPRADVIRLASDPSTGSVELDLPLNGEWSDLTALFEFGPVDGGIALSLYDLHVLVRTPAPLPQRQ
jgi:hypothetical protein